MKKFIKKHIWGPLREWIIRKAKSSFERSNKFVNRQTWIVKVFALIGAGVVLYQSTMILGACGINIVKETIYGFHKTITVENVHAYVDARQEGGDVTEISVREPSTPSNDIEVGENISLEDQIKKEIKKVFAEDSDVAVAVATAENREFNPRAVGDKHLVCKGYLGNVPLDFYCKRDGKQYGASYGIFQIRYLPGRPEPEELMIWEKNVEYAHDDIFLKSGWFPWSTFKDNSYLKFL